MDKHPCHANERGTKKCPLSLILVATSSFWVKRRFHTEAPQLGAITQHLVVPRCVRWVCLRRAPCYRFIRLFNDALANKCVLRMMIIQRHLSGQFYCHQLFIHTMPFGSLSSKIRTGIKFAILRFGHTTLFTYNISSIKHLFNQYFTAFCFFDPPNRGYCGLLYSNTFVTLKLVNVNTSTKRTAGNQWNTEYGYDSNRTLWH
jgi:hypothetical protein